MDTIRGLAADFVRLLCARTSVLQAAVRVLPRKGVAAALARAELEVRWRVPEGLGASVRFDRHGRATVSAGDEASAMRALGWLHGRDRAFQMDLLRRQAEGRLSELLGATAAEADVRARWLDLTRLASLGVAAMPREEMELLEAYCAGHAAWSKQGRPFEAHAGEPVGSAWRPEDSVAIILWMFDTLSGEERARRCAAVMQSRLPVDLWQFLTSDEDPHPCTVLGGPDACRAMPPLPVPAIARVLAGRRSEVHPGRSLLTTLDANGSSAWAVDGTRTPWGGAVVANDIHLPFTVPNLLHRAAIHVGSRRWEGVWIPGIPYMVAGSNGHLAWGIANACCDDTRLVTLPPSVLETGVYRTRDAEHRTSVRIERITVRDAAERCLRFYDTLWGPVSTDRIVERPYALWSAAARPKATDLRFHAMTRARSIEEAMDVASTAGLPALSIVVGAADGRIAWTMTRSVSVRAAEAWPTIDAASLDTGSVSEGARPPRVVDVDEGDLVAANNRLIGAESEARVGYNFAPGWRAHRIRQLLRASASIDEAACAALQLDADAGFYEFYRRLLLESAASSGSRWFEQRVRRALATPSSSMGLLRAFRRLLADAIFSALLAPCVEADPNFTYDWANVEGPLRRILAERDQKTFPFGHSYASWDAYIQHVARVALKRPAKPGRHVWPHPLRGRYPRWTWLLDHPGARVRGDSHVVRVATPRHGAVVRFVVAPGREWSGFYQAPGGQSGSPLSRHYADTHRGWIRGVPLPFRAPADVPSSPLESS